MIMLRLKLSSLQKPPATSMYGGAHPCHSTLSSTSLEEFPGVLGGTDFNLNTFRNYCFFFLVQTLLVLIGCFNHHLLNAQQVPSMGKGCAPLPGAVANPQERSVPYLVAPHSLGCSTER